MFQLLGFDLNKLARYTSDYIGFRKKFFTVSSVDIFKK